MNNTVPPQSVQRKGQKFPIVPTLLLVWVSLMTFLSRTVISPLLLEIEQTFGLTHTEGGSLFLVISVGLVSTMLLSGFLLQKITHRLAIISSALLTAAGLLILALARQLLLFQFGLFIIGAGAGLYLPSGLTTLTDQVSPKQWGRAIAIHELGPILGLASAPFFAELALRFGNWRILFIALSFFSLIAAGGFSRFSSGGHFNGTPPAWRAIGSLLRNRNFRIIALLFIMALGLEMGVFSMLPIFLVDHHGLDRSLVNIVVSSSRLTALLVVFFSGRATDRYGNKPVLAAVTLTSGAATILLGFAEGALLLAVLYLQPMLVSAFFPPGIAALTGVSSVKERNLAVSLVIPVAYLFGAGFFPTLIGRLAEFGYFGLGFIIVGAAMVGAGGMALLLEV